MTEPLSDRLLDVLGDATARRVVQELVNRELSQADLVEAVGFSQPAVSRAVRLLRALGLVSGSTGSRGEHLRLVGRDELSTVLLATDRLAEALVKVQAAAQAERSRRTRRAVIKPTHGTDESAAT